MSRAALAALAALATLGVPGPVAAETWQTCNGFITSLPAVITTQGTWCMDRDLSTVVTSGPAIRIATNNVTIDCNGYKLGNLGAGTGTTAVGIQSNDRRNVVLRGCHVRGFAYGILLTGGVTAQVTSAGHVVEDSLVEASTTQGITVKGLNSLVRRNRVVDIGPNPAGLSVAGIATVGTVDVVDNLVDGVEMLSTSASPGWGIYAEPVDGVAIGRNRIRGVLPGLGFAYGIFVAGADGSLSSIRENTITRSATNLLWIRCAPGYLGAARENVAAGWTSGSSDCYELEEVGSW